MTPSDWIILTIAAAALVRSIALINRRIQEEFDDWYFGRRDGQ